MTIPTSVQFQPAAGDDTPLWPSLVPVQKIAPAASALVWFDSSTSPPTLKGWNGSAWVAIGGAGGGVDVETVRDTIGSALVAGSGIGITVNDPGDTITVANSAPAQPFMPLVPKVGGTLGPPDVTQWFTNSNQFRTSGNAAAVRIMVAKSIQVDALVCRVDVAEAASTVRMGLFSSDSDGHPLSRLAEVSVAGTAAGVVVGTFAPITLAPGLYHAPVYGSSTTTLRLRMCKQASDGMVGPSTGGLPVNGNQFLAANYGSSAALVAGPLTTWTQDLPDQMTLAALRRSA